MCLEKPASILLKRHGLHETTTLPAPPPFFLSAKAVPKCFPTILSYRFRFSEGLCSCFKFDSAEMGRLQNEEHEAPNQIEEPIGGDRNSGICHTPYTLKQTYTKAPRVMSLISEGSPTAPRQNPTAFCHVESIDFT